MRLLTEDCREGMFHSLNWPFERKFKEETLCLLFVYMI